MTTKGNPAVLDHDGIENEAASTSILPESPENADGQNDRFSHALTSDEIRAFIGTSGDEIGKGPAIDSDPALVQPRSSTG